MNKSGNRNKHKMNDEIKIKIKTERNISQLSSPGRKDLKRKNGDGTRTNRYFLFKVY